MTLTESTTQTIRDELVTGIETANRRRKNRYRIALAAPLLVLAATAAVFLPFSNTEPAFALMQQADGTIRVEVYHDFDQVGDLQQALADVGVESIVVHLKGHPSLDGVVEVASHGNEQSGVFEFDNGEFVIDPVKVQGEVEILIYAAAADGEPYQFAPSIFAPGQALAGLPCAYVDGPLSTADLELQAEQVGIRVIEWVLFDRAAPGETGEEGTERPTEAVVIGAQLANANTLRVITSLEGSDPASETLTLSDGTHYRQPAICTPELAALWD